MAPSKDRTVTEREFEYLLCGANAIENERRRIESRAVLLLGGRLGLRPGEITHLRGSWVDWDRQIISIPEHQPCDKGQNGGLCGYCRQAVEQRLKHGAEESFAALGKRYWVPKTKAAARAVPFHFSWRVHTTLKQLIEHHGGWAYSFSTLQRRLQTALEKAPRLSPNQTTPHGLRATAASYHAGRGLDLPALRAMFGWEDIDTARQYLNIDGSMTRRALSEIH
ncbi:tyrosine-type recombinase/integrase [Halobaculum magnesiiphilum]|uniref:Site-specific integrase n=1 Tax=Halobaculum magnesiiphilum TaxID=1017351 RepID=A0A8T8WH76_9EURY|nr:tyrosine-type recombinase/integrase [Halobaculum magnesiiphilum]QZP39195.1 site-specific integrase [Halobaculum magnesiiphilum]